MIEFIEKHWTYIVTFGTVIAYLFEKGRAIWLEKRLKRTSYNRIFTAVLKLYFSYLKHAEFYSEKAPLNFPDEIYIPMLKHLTNFNSDIDEFKQIVDKESDIVPEIMIQTHMLFDAVDRIRIVDRIQASNPQNHLQLSDTESLGVKRAQFYAMKEIYDEFFEEIIDNLQEKTCTSTDFIEKIKYFNTEEYQKENNIEQRKTMKKYYESLKRQGIISEEEFYSTLKEYELE